MVTCSDPEGVDILDLCAGESEDFSDIDTDMTDELLGEDPEKMIGNLVDTCSHAIAANLGIQSQPNLESGLSSLELDDGQLESGTSCAATTDTTVPAIASPCAADETQPSEDMEVSDLSDQPGLQFWGKEIMIKGVGDFRHSDGQSLQMNAYPHVVRPSATLTGGQPQAYRGQDQYCPTAICPRHARKERQQRQEEAQRRMAEEGAQAATAGATEAQGGLGLG